MARLNGMEFQLGGVELYTIALQVLLTLGNAQFQTLELRVEETERLVGGKQEAFGQLLIRTFWRVAADLPGGPALLGQELVYDPTERVLMAHHKQG